MAPNQKNKNGMNFPFRILLIALGIISVVTIRRSFQLIPKHDKAEELLNRPFALDQNHPAITATIKTRLQKNYHSQSEGRKAVDASLSLEGNEPGQQETTSKKKTQQRVPESTIDREKSTVGERLKLINSTSSTSTTDHRPILILHMGPDQTGTKLIQMFLRDHYPEINRDGYDAELSRKTQASFFKNCFVTTNLCPSNHWKDSIDSIHQLAGLHWNNTNATTNLLLSNEEFRWANFSSENWRMFRHDMEPYFQIRVVLVYRRYHEWLVSRYKEEWKVKGPDGAKVLNWPGYLDGQETPTFATILERERNGTCSDLKMDCKQYFQHRRDYDSGKFVHPTLSMKQALEAQKIPVTIVNFHTDKLLQEFFCQGLQMPATCAQSNNSKFVSNISNFNPSSDDIVWDQLATAARNEGLVVGNLARNFVKAELKNQLLVVWKKTVSDLPYVCPPPALLEDFRLLSYESEVALMPHMASAHGKAFQQAVTENQFCSVDTSELLKKESWKEFFQSLGADKEESTLEAILETPFDESKNSSHLPYLVLHMGPDKTGTTSIQNFLLTNTQLLLEKDHYDPTYSRGTRDKGRKDVTSYLVSCLINGRNGKKAYHRMRKWKKGWFANLEHIQQTSRNNNHSNILFSTEEFRWASLRNDDWANFLQMMRPHFRIRVVLVYRRYFEWLFSRYNEEWKMDGPEAIKVLDWPPSKHDNATIGTKGQYTPPFATFYEWERNGTLMGQKLSWDTYFSNRVHHLHSNLTHPTLAMKETLEQQGIHVTVINYHKGNLLERFLCEGLPMANHSCAFVKKQEAKSLKNPSGNEILYDRIATAAHDQGLLPDDCSRRSAKITILRYHERKLKLTPEDLPLICMNGTMLEEFGQVSLGFEKAVLPSSMTTDHNDEFDKAGAKKKFCQVDTRQVLQDKHWKSFFSSECACNPGCYKNISRLN